MFRSSRPDYIETPAAPTPNTGPSEVLFRSSRPDYIETITTFSFQIFDFYCSGLPDRTTLRRTGRTRARGTRADCSGLPDRTTLRPGRPLPTWRISAHIVPVFQTGLYIEAGTLERRGGEVLPGGIGPDVLCSYQSLFLIPGRGCDAPSAPRDNTRSHHRASRASALPMLNEPGLLFPQA